MLALRSTWFYLCRLQPKIARMLYDIKVTSWVCVDH